nr:2-C-methyl-D-erythritol 4-phosphate cytidylyltransferase [Acinetobacter sp. Marseille-Q1620]
MPTKTWVIIPAAGSGSRFSKTELKQYQMIQGKTVLEHTVSRLNTLDLAGYVLAIAEDDNVAKNLKFANQEKAHFCIGGQERVHSVLNALNYLVGIAAPDDLILVHDAARPCISHENLLQLVNDAKCHGNSILAIPVRDTLKYVPEHNIIDKTVSRDFLWQAQTPQVATLSILKNAIELALKDQVVITDEASALEYAGETVYVVQGRSDNIKITYPDDLELAKLILLSQNHS